MNKQYGKKHSKNKLERNKKILAQYKELKKMYEFSDTKIWRDHIYPVYYISLDTFRRILTLNIGIAERRMNEANEGKNEGSNEEGRS